jgi:hypothetical protein
MENITPEQRKKPNYTLLILATAAIVFSVYYTLIMLTGPGKKLSSLEKEYSFVQEEKNKTDEKIFSDSSYLSLFKERSFLQARIAMAATDSIYLTINLADSSLNLEISGVTVHTAKILKSKISKIIDRNDYRILSMLAKPFTISDNYSSIQKEPLMIKMAPKDTSEFQPDIIPDTADFEPVNFIFQTDNGTRIIIYQEEKLKPGDGLHLFIFDLWFRMKDALSSLKSAMKFKTPEYHPIIKLRVHRADAKIIYRAMPEHGQIAVYR